MWVVVGFVVRYFMTRFEFETIHEVFHHVLDAVFLIGYFSFHNFEFPPPPICFEVSGIRAVEAGEKIESCSFRLRIWVRFQYCFAGAVWIPSS